MNASIYTLGCRLNQADSALIADDLQRRGYCLVPWGKPADLLVVNSCIVTAAAGQKSRQALRAARRRNPKAFVVMVGCSVNVESENLLKEGCVDLLVPNRAKTRLSQYLPENLTPSDRATLVTPDESRDGNLFSEAGTGLHTDRTRANLKIQEGCDFFCSYCIVPYARGNPVSRNWDDVLREAKSLIARGHREMVLTGVNIANYRDRDRGLADLLEALAALPGDFRLRLGSTEPGTEVKRIVEVMAEHPGKICRFLHLSMQYAEDTILKAMNRRYTSAEFAEWADYAAGKLPGLCMGSDIIVGFPGESEKTFAACAERVRTLPFSYLHVFTYSPREGTPAATMPNQVRGDLADQRRKTLLDIAGRKALAFAGSTVGQILTVLPEKRNQGGLIQGWSDNYLQVAIENMPEKADLDGFIPVEISQVVDGRNVRGRPVDRG